MVVGELDDDFETRHTLGHRHQRWFIFDAGAFDQITFPMTHNLAILNFCGALLDGLTVDAFVRPYMLTGVMLNPAAWLHR